MASYFCDGSIATQSLIRPERPVVAYSVEKLCFEMGGDFICDLSDIEYCSYEGVAEAA